MIIEHDSLSFVARPVYNLILCFVCDKEANLGLVRSKVEVMGKQLDSQFASIEHHLKEHEQDGQGDEEEDQ